MCNLLAPEILSRDGSLTRGLQPIGTSNSRLATWLVDSAHSLDKAQRETSAIDKNVAKLSQLLQQIEMLHATNVGAGDSEVFNTILSLYYILLLLLRAIHRSFAYNKVSFVKIIILFQISGKLHTL